MSFFAYLAIELGEETHRTRLVELLEQQGLAPTRQQFAERYGASALYGFEPREGLLFELELSPEIDIETRLLDLGHTTKRRHYQDVARRLGRPAARLGEDAVLHAAFLASPLELPVVALLRQIANDFSQRPIVMVLDPEFTARFGKLTELRGFDEIVSGTWRAAALRDLEEPLRLVLTG